MSYYCYHCNYNFFALSNTVFKCLGCGELIRVDNCSCWEYDEEKLSPVKRKKTGCEKVIVHMCSGGECDYFQEVPLVGCHYLSQDGLCTNEQAWPENQSIKDGEQ